MKSIKIIALLLCLGALFQVQASTDSKDKKNAQQVEHKRQDEKEIKVRPQQQEDTVYQATQASHKFPPAVWDIVRGYVIDPDKFFPGEDPYAGLSCLHNFVRQGTGELWLLDAATLMSLERRGQRQALTVYNPETGAILFQKSLSIASPHHWSCPFVRVRDNTFVTMRHDAKALILLDVQKKVTPELTIALRQAFDNNDHPTINYACRLSDTLVAASSGKFGRITIWDVSPDKEPKVCKELAVGFKDPSVCTSMALLHDGRLATAWDDGCVRVWDMKKDQDDKQQGQYVLWKVQRRTGGTETLPLVELCAPVKGYLCGCTEEQGSLYVWDTSKEQSFHVLVDEKEQEMETFPRKKHPQLIIFPDQSVGVFKGETIVRVALKELCSSYKPERIRIPLKNGQGLDAVYDYDINITSVLPTQHMLYIRDDFHNLYDFDMQHNTLRLISHYTTAYVLDAHGDIVLLSSSRHNYYIDSCRYSERERREVEAMPYQCSFDFYEIRQEIDRLQERRRIARHKRAFHRAILVTGAFYIPGKETGMVQSFANYNHYEGLGTVVNARMFTPTWSAEEKKLREEEGPLVLTGDTYAKYRNLPRALQRVLEEHMK